MYESAGAQGCQPGVLGDSGMMKPEGRERLRPKLGKVWGRRSSSVTLS